MTTDPDNEALRQRRSEIRLQLATLRSVISDLERHKYPPNASVADLTNHANAVQDARNKLHELDLEYVRLT